MHGWILKADVHSTWWQKLTIQISIGLPKKDGVKTAAEAIHAKTRRALNVAEGSCSKDFENNVKQRTFQGSMFAWLTF